MTDENETLSLKEKLKNKNFQKRSDAYEEIQKWQSNEYTQEDFINDLPDLSKEKHWKVLGYLIDTIETIIDEQIFQNLNIISFYANFLDCMMSNAKADSQTKLEALIPNLWDCWNNKKSFIEQINKNLLSKKPKILEKSCSFLEILLLNANIEELQFLKPILTNLLKLTKQKSPVVRKAVIKVLKEAYLWMGDKFNTVLENPNLDKASKNELEKYIDGVMKSDMKVGQKKVKQKKSKPQVQEQQPQSNNQDNNTVNESTNQNFQSQINTKPKEEESNTFQSEFRPRQTKDLLQDIQIEEVENFENFDELKESLFKEKNLIMENFLAQQKIIVMHMKIALKMTKDFSECNKIQLKFLYQIFEKIILKFQPNVFGMELHQICTQFILEQMIYSRKEELFLLINKYTNPEQKIITFKDFIQNLLNEIQRKNSLITNDLVYCLSRIIEKEIVFKKNINLIPFKQLTQFVNKNKFENDQKKRLFNLMKNFQEIFGKQIMSDFSPAIMKEFETVSKDIEKEFQKIIAKFKLKNQEERKAALLALSEVNDITLLTMLWKSRDFQDFIKRSLIIETQLQQYDVLLQIIEKYLFFNRDSPADFLLQSYLYVFHTIITQYYDIKELQNEGFQKKKLPLLQNIFNKTVERLEPTTIFNQLINDSNAQNWKEQICGFYLQYSDQISVDSSFMNYIIDVFSIKSNTESEFFRFQLEKVIIALKNNPHNDVQDIGSKNPIIKKIWQQSEEQILFSSDFVSFENVFRDQGFYKQVKNFIIKALDITEYVFYNIKIDSFIIESERHQQTKAQLAYFLLRSNENIYQISLHISNQIQKLEFSQLDITCLSIIFRILLNLMKNLTYGIKSDVDDSLFEDIIDKFGSLVEEERIFEDELRQFNLQPCEEKIYHFALQKYEKKKNEDSYYEEEEQYQNISTIRDRQQNETFNDQQSRSNYNPDFSINRGVKRRPQRDEFQDNDVSYYEPQQDLSQYNIQSSKSQLSRGSLSKKRSMIGMKQNMNERQKDIELVIQKLLSYDLEDVKEARNFLMGMIMSNNSTDIEFLAQKINELLNVYTSMFETIFEEGINFDVETENYKDIFEPVKNLCQLKQVMTRLNQNTLNEIAYNTLLRLVTSNEEKLRYEENKNQGYQELEDITSEEQFNVASFIVKYFNGIMLRLLDNSDINMIYTSLFAILIQHQNFENDKLTEKIFSLDLYCINRLTKQFKNKISEINPIIILQNVKAYLDTFGMDNSNELRKRATGIVRVLMKELVFNFNEQQVWDAYSQVEGEENNSLLFKYIVLLQEKSRQGQGGQQQGQQQINNDSNQLKNELMKIINMVNQETQERQLPVYLQQISRILQKSPQIQLRNFRQYFHNQQVFQYFLNELQGNRQQGNNPQQMDEFLNQSDLSYVTNRSNIRNRY